MRSTAKHFISAFIFVVFGSFLFASGLENRNAIGVYIIGSENPVGGIQYERRFSDLISEKFGIYAMYNPDSYSTQPFDFNFTAETDFKLYETTWKGWISSRLFAYALAGYDVYIKREYSYYDEYNHISSDSKDEIVNNAILSAGFGFDFIFFDHLSIPIEFGFMGTFPNEPHIGFCGGISVRYGW